MPDNSTKIAALEKLLQSGAKSITIDGIATTYRSTKDIMQAINRLKQDDTVNGYTVKRRVRSINLSGF